MGKQKTPNASRKHNPARLVTLQMSQRALELRASGMSYPQIASRLGFKSYVSAIKAVQRCLDLTIGPVSEDVRALELERLDRLLAVWWPRAVQGTPLRHPETGAVVMTIDPATDAAVPLLDYDHQSLASVLSILDRRYKLSGLDRANQSRGDDPRDIILGILRQVVTEDDAGRHQETRLVVTSWRPAEVDGEDVMVDGMPPRLPDPPGVDEDEAWEGAEPAQTETEDVDGLAHRRPGPSHRLPEPPAVNDPSEREAARSGNQRDGTGDMMSRHLAYRTFMERQGERALSYKEWSQAR